MSSYRLFGAETSPYSLKVRSFLRYKGADFEWIARSAETDEAFQAEASVPTLPLLLSPNRPASQDSTYILAALETDLSEPNVIPEDKALASLALVLEDYADEWLSKLMFFYRWGGKPDREDAGERTMEQLFQGNLPRAKKRTRDEIAKKMRGYLPLIGIEKKNEKVLKRSFETLFQHLETHLQAHKFLFGGRPSVADFAFSGQISQLLRDPTPAAWLAENAPAVVAWASAMDAPVADGPFATLDDLKTTLLPLFLEEVAMSYLPWAAANLTAAEAKSERMDASIGGQAFAQVTQQYAARSFRTVVKAVAASAATEASLTEFLEAAAMKDAFAA